MSRFTISISELAELYTIFDFDYDTVSGKTKPELELAFMREYANREIGYETYQQWKPKFEQLWCDMIEKYKPLFAKNVDVFNSYKTTNSGVQTGESTNSSVMKHIPTPVTTIMAESDIPNSYTSGDGGGTSKLEQESVTTRQSKSDLEMLNKYIKEQTTILRRFISEFNTLMFKRY